MSGVGDRLPGDAPAAADPPRLIDDPGVDRALREALRQSATHAPPLPADGLARLEAATGAGGGAAAGTIAAGVAAVLIAAGAAWLAAGGATDDERPTGGPTAEIAPPAPTTTDEPTARADLAGGDVAEEIAAPTTTVVEAPARPPQEEEEAAPGPVAPRAPRVSRDETPGDPGPEARPAEDGEADTDDGALAREMAQLAAARRAIASDPARALSLLDEGHRSHPGSMFAEERAALRVLALAGLDRIDEARRDGQRFLAAYPSSPHAERVRRAIAP